MVVMNLKCPSSESGSLVLRLALGHILKKGMFSSRIQPECM
ncbi:hypothetical protein SAMN05192535_4153 [Shouchella rhizosphaerae]|nr:hypothetical protein SAMN05192535_4153 [Shouchella rhizosphaerae]